MAELYRELAKDDVRNWTIAQDVAQALELGRVPLVLTERREHVDVLADQYEEDFTDSANDDGDMSSRGGR